MSVLEVAYLPGSAIWDLDEKALSGRQITRNR
jgi:hypothetical protein